jgi:hypothetical protein
VAEVAEAVQEPTDEQLFAPVQRVMAAQPDPNGFISVRAGTLQGLLLQAPKTFRGGFVPDAFMDELLNGLAKTDG